MIQDATPLIVVTGRALDAAHAEEPLAVTTLDKDRLRSSGASGLEQVLQQVAGVQLFRRSDARSANPTSQGITLRALGGNASSRALLFLDGVPQTDPFGGWINWPAYDPLALAEVRVTRGGGSVAGGPGALAGTIELSSSATDAILLSAAGGSRGSAEGRAVVNRAVGRTLVGISLHGSRGDGFVPITAATRGPIDEPAPYRNASGRVRWVAPLSRSIEVQASLSAFRDERSRGLPFSDNSSEGADGALRLVGRGAWQWSALAYAQRRTFQSSFAATDIQRKEARRTSLQYHVPGRALGWRVELRPPLPDGWELRLGADGRRMRGRSEELGGFTGGTATRDRRSGGQTSHSGAYAEASWRAGSLLLTGGARIDRFRVTGGRFTERVIATDTLSQDLRFPERSEWLPTARGGVRVGVTRSVDLRAAAYLGWRPPTVNELFRPFRLGSDATAANAGLAPERLAGAELGVDWRVGRGQVQLTAFRNRLADAIANVTLGEGPGVFPEVGFVPAGGLFRQRRNLDRITGTGVEAGAAWSRGEWRLAADASWTRARVEDRGRGRALSGLRPAQTPALAVAASASWTRKPMMAALQLRYTGPQYEDDLNRIRLPGGAVVDGLAGWQLGRRVQLLLRGENLFNARLLAARSNDGADERITPRTLWVEARWSDGLAQ